MGQLVGQVSKVENVIQEKNVDDFCFLDELK